MSAPPANWSAVIERQAHRLYQQIAATQRLAESAQADAAMTEQACAPYHRLLDELYTHEWPVARALDRSDLLLHLDGEALQNDSPPVALVAGIMSDVRKQIGSMIRTLVSSFHEGVELPREIGLGLSSFAQGSLYLGFSLPQPGPGEIALPGDPFFAASREALVTLGTITAQIDAADGYEKIRHDFADPKLRDAALSAVGHLAPSGRRGVSSVTVGGRLFRDRPWSTLTPQTRQQIRAWLDRPVLSDEVHEFRGQVRAIDLDLRRFDLRRVGGGREPDLRCIYPALFDGPASGWLDAVIVVRGRVDSFQGLPRLVQVETVTADEPSLRS